MSGWASHSVFIAATWVAAIFGGIGVGAAFISAIVGYQLTEDALSDANREIASAREEARVEIEKTRSEANKAVAEAQVDITRATAETAKANERTAELKLALEKEIAARKPRTITPEQRARIVEMLRTEPRGSVVVVWKAFDEEAERFAKAVVSVLKDAGYDASEYAGPAILSFGIPGQWITVRDPAWLKRPSYAGSIQATFDRILNIFFSATPWPNNDAATKAVSESVPVLIVVGAKPSDTHDWGAHPPQ
jgi:hypothetical protein